MVGEHFPSGWSDRQVSIDSIGGAQLAYGQGGRFHRDRVCHRTGAGGQAKRVSCPANLLPVGRHTIHRTIGGAARAA